MLYRSSSRDKTQQPVLQVSDYYWNIRELEHSTYLRDILVLKIASSCLLLFHPTVSEKYLRIATVPWQAYLSKMYYYISLSSKGCWRIWKKTYDCQPAVMFCWECSFFPFFSTSQLFSSLCIAWHAAILSAFEVGQNTRHVQFYMTEWTVVLHTYTLHYWCV